jgi:hypothetical protein
MKYNVLTISSALAAVASIFILPVSSVAAGVIFVLAGILAISVADYGRSTRPLSLRAEVVPFSAPVQALNSLSEAA